MEKEKTERPFELTWEQKQVVTRAREIISDKEHWSRGQCARYLHETGEYKACSAFDPEAVKFDAYGALTRAAYERSGDKTAASKLADEIENAIPHPADARFKVSLVQYSDSRGHQAVLDLFDRILANRTFLTE